jgi:hypothetical protein
MIIKANREAKASNCHQLAHIHLFQLLINYLTMSCLQIKSDINPTSIRRKDSRNQEISLFLFTIFYRNGE